MSDSQSAPKVEIYTKFGCPYCYRATALLRQKNVEFVEYDISMGGEKRDEMRRRKADARTVPQIFIDDRAIGGCDDMMALDRAGKLDAMLGR
jgi:glutaredoxin 3